MSGSPSKYIWVTRREPNAGPRTDTWMWDGRQAFAPITQEDLDTVLTDGARIEVLDAGIQPDDGDLPLVVVDGGGTPRVADPSKPVGAADRLVALRPPERASG